MLWPHTGCLNELTGGTTPSDSSVPALHAKPHKTLSTPHRGGPGADAAAESHAGRAVCPRDGRGAGTADSAGNAAARTRSAVCA